MLFVFYVGFNVDDEIIVVNDYCISFFNFDRMFGVFVIGDDVELLIIWCGKLMCLSLGLEV